MILTTALACLAINLYHESRGEPPLGQYAVALVTINRAGGDHAQVCAEVFKPYQFSWTNKYKVVHTRQGNWALPEEMRPVDKEAWARSKAIASLALDSQTDITGGAQFYHATHVRPQWSKKFTPTVRIKNHIFYTQESK